METSSLTNHQSPALKRSTLRLTGSSKTNWISWPKRSLSTGPRLKIRSGLEGKNPSNPDLAEIAAWETQSPPLTTASLAASPNLAIATWITKSSVSNSSIRIQSKPKIRRSSYSNAWSSSKMFWHHPPISKTFWHHPPIKSTLMHREVNQWSNLSRRFVQEEAIC